MNKTDQPKAILALDPATSCGYAYTSKDSIKYGTKIFKRNGLEDEHHGHQFKSLYDTIYRVHREERLATIYFEQGGYSQARNSSAMFYGWRAAVLMFCADYNIQHKEIPPTRWKNRLINKGNASKYDVWEYFKNKGFELSPGEDDTSDALGVLNYALLDHKCTFLSFPKYERGKL